MKTHVTCRINNRADLTALAKRLYTVLPLPAVLALTGDLGSGKTTFTQDLAQVYGITSVVPSPTFTLVNQYATDSLTFVHADLYRLVDTDEITLLGLSDYFDAPNTITVVEWADRLPNLFPPQTLWLHFQLLPSGTRLATLNNQDPNFWLKLDIESSQGEL